MEEVIVYSEVLKGDLVRCCNCGKVMLLPYGSDKCPECGSIGTQAWYDEEQESNVDELEGKGLKIRYEDRELKPEDYISPDELEY